MRRVPRTKTLRRALGLTQEGFAARFQIPLGTLRDWEQGRAEPDHTARAYLRAIVGDASAVAHALKAGPEPHPIRARCMSGVDRPMLVRANDVLERAMKLDDAVAELRQHRSMLEDLSARPPIKLARPHVLALAVVRACILRSTIVLAVAILDLPDRRRKNRASLGQIFDLLMDQALADVLAAPNAKRYATPNAQKLAEARTVYDRLLAGETAARAHLLRHSIAHLLAQAESSELPNVEYSDVFMLVDKIEQCFTLLYQGLGIRLARFVGLKELAAEQARLFWETYLRGVSAA